jgi:hypothetical protein
MSSLSQLQREMAQALRHRSSLERDEHWTQFASTHISGSARLSPVEQLEIYREQFWLRHTSSLVEDFPGLGGILGQADWERLAEDYLQQVAPTSFTLRDLGQRLPDIIAGAQWLPHRELCLDMARLELAYIDAFDAPDSAPLSPARLALIQEDELLQSRLVLAPCVRLLELDYPVANLRRTLKRDIGQAVSIPAAQPHKLVVYRKDLRLWDMPLSPVAFTFIEALQRGERLDRAAECAATCAAAEAEVATNIGAWFGEWTGKGLICDVATQ